MARLKKEFMRMHKVCTSLLVGSWLVMGMPMAQAQVNTPSLVGTQAQRGQLSEKDYRFVEKSYRSGLEEVQLGELAKQKAISQAVREFGERMVTDHTKATDQLRQIATQKGAALPNQMSRGETATFQHLRNKSGVDFDKSYARDMVKDHNHDVKEFQDGAKELADPDLKAWAQTTLAVLEQHKRLAQELDATVKNEK
jgi:putative membrane protein